MNIFRNVDYADWLIYASTIEIFASFKSQISKKKITDASAS